MQINQISFSIKSGSCLSSAAIQRVKEREAEREREDEVRKCKTGNFILKQQQAHSLHTQQALF